MYICRDLLDSDVEDDIGTDFASDIEISEPEIASMYVYFSIVQIHLQTMFIVCTLQKLAILSTVAASVLNQWCAEGIGHNMCSIICALYARCFDDSAG